MRARTKAAVYMVLSAFAFAVMGGFVKLAPAVSLADKVAVRNLVTLFIAAVLVVRRRCPLLGQRRNRIALLARSLLGIGGVVCYFYAIDHLLLANATMLTRLSPFFAGVFAALFLREPLSRRLLLAMAVGLAGGMCVLKPRLDLDLMPALVGFGSAVFAGAAYAVLRYLGNREPPETIVLHFSLCSVLCMLPFVLVDLRRPSPRELGWLLGIGVTAALGQLLLTAAYRHAPTAEVSVYGDSMILFAAVIGLLFWGEVPDTLSLLGGALIMAGGVTAFLSPSASAPPTASAD